MELINAKPEKTKPTDTKTTADVHRAAINALTDEWQSVTTLNRVARTVYFEDLVWAGVADRKVDPIIKHGVQCGSRTFYRLAKNSEVV